MPEYDKDLENWARNVRQTPRTVATPKTLFELVAAVKGATDAGRHCRAVGTMWSFSESIRCADSIIDTTGLTGALGVARAPWTGPLAAALVVSAKVATKAYVHVRSGTTLRDVLALLAQGNMAIGTMGSSAGQRVAGLLATGSHGAEFDLPPPVDYVRAIHLVLPDGSQRWIEPAGARAITRTEGVLTITTGLTKDDVVYDDALFDAALVSIGTLGVIYSLVLEVRDPGYALEEATDMVPWTTVRAALAAGTAFHTPLVASRATPPPGETPRFRSLELLMNPYVDPDKKVLMVRVVTRFEAATATRASWTRPPRTVDIFEKIRIFATVLGRDDAAYHDVIDALQTGNRANSDCFAPAADVNDTKSDLRVPIDSMEIAISTRDGRHVKLLDELFHAFELRRQRGQDFAGFWAVRFTQPTRALLGMQARGALDAADVRVMHVEIFALQGLDLTRPPSFANPDTMEGDNEAIMVDFAAIARSLGARLHWGQWAPRDAPQDDASYAGRSAWRDARRRLVGARGTSTFDSDFTVRAGLALFEPGWSSPGALPTERSAAPSDTRALRTEAPAIASRAGGPMVIAAANGDGRIGIGELGKSFTRVGPKNDARVVMGRVGLGIDAGARRIVVARFDDDRVRSWRSDAPSRPWNLLDGSQRFTGSPTVVLAPDGRLRVVALDRDGKTLWTRTLESDGDWDNAWTRLAVSAVALVGSPSAIYAADGALEVAVRGSLEVQHFRCASGAAPVASNLGVGSLVDPSIVSDPAGVSVYAVDGLPTVTRRRAGQTTFASEALPGAVPTLPGSRVAALRGATSPLLAYTDANGAVHLHRRANDAWSSVAVLPARSMSGPSIAARGTEVVIATRYAHDIVQTLVWPGV